METFIRYISILSSLENQMRYAQDKRVLLEVSLIRLMHPEMDSDYDALVNRIDELERKIDSGEIQTQKIFFHKTGFLATFPKKEWAEIIAYESSQIYDK